MAITPNKLIEALFRGSSQKALARKINELIDALSGALPGQGGGGTLEPLVASISVVASVSLLSGQTQTLIPTAYDFSGIALTGVNFEYTTLDADIATVSTLGAVQAVNTGSTEILVSAGGKTATVVAVVNATASVDHITVTPNTFSLSSGETRQLTAEAWTQLNLEIEGVQFTFSTSNPAVATVSSTGLVTGISVGNATITVTGGGRSVTASVTVSAGVVASITVIPSTVEMTHTGTQQLNVLPLDSAGNTVVGAVVTFASQNPAVCTVTSGGLISATNPGNTNVAVSSGAVTVLVPVAVSAVGIVSQVTGITPSFTQDIGFSTTVQATAKDSANGVVTDAVITWTSSNPSVVSITDLGTVNGVGSASVDLLSGGTATITAAVGSITASMDITVNPAATTDIALIVVTPANPTITTGGSQQFVATAKDSSGNVLTGKTFTWGTSDPTVATVSSSGLATAVSGGNAIIQASSEGVAGSTTLHIALPSSYTSPNALSTVKANPVPGLYALPNTFLETRYGLDENGNPLTFVDVSISASGNPTTDQSNLQAAINTALATAQHTRIKLANGFESRNIKFGGPNTQGPYWLYIEPADQSWMPAEGVRIDEADISAFAAGVPTITTATSGVPAVGCAPGGVNRVRFTGIHIRPSSALADWVNGVGGDQVFALVLLEARDNLDATHGALADMPDLMYFDRCWINGSGLGKDQDRSLVQHAIVYNTKRFAMVDSVCGGNWLGGYESHACNGRSTQGPLKFVNNKIWGGSISLFFGGADPYVQDLYPEDVEIRRNFIWHPLWWLQPHPQFDGTNRNIKNAFEIKYGRRYFVEGNIFDGMEQGWQNGQLISLKVENSGGAASGAETKDITIRYNILRNAAGGIWFAGYGFTGPVEEHPILAPTHQVEIAHNVCYNIGSLDFGTSNRLIVVTADPYSSTFHHNTFFTAQTNASLSHDILLTSSGTKASELTWRDNIFSGVSTYGIFGDGGKIGADALNAFVQDVNGVPTWTYTNNVHRLGFSSTKFPAGNSYPANLSDIAFADTATNDFHLTTAFRGTASDGGDPGADIDTVNLATAGVDS